MTDFHLSNLQPEVRIINLSNTQKQNLDEVLSALAQFRSDGKNSKQAEKELLLFLLPMVELGLTVDQIIRFVNDVPAHFPLDHREIYFDFRLQCWIRHVEPLTISQSLDEYFENAESPERGLAYLKEQWGAFLKRHQLK